MTRQTLDSPIDDYDRLHDEVHQFAGELGLSSRDLIAQRVLRALVARMLADPELRRDVLEDARRQVDQEPGTPQ